MIGYTFIKRNSLPIKAASPIFVFVILFGSLLGFVSAATLLVVQPTEILCHVRVWALGISFFISFGALYLKEYRILLIFNPARKMSPIAISPKILLLGLAGVVGLGAITLVISSLGEVAVVATPRLDDPAVSELTCTSNPFYQIPLLGYAGIMIFVGPYPCTFFLCPLFTHQVWCSRSVLVRSTPSTMSLLTFN